MSSTQNRNLRGGHSIWEKDLIDLPLNNTEAFKCDVVVVGGGISGALLAEALSARKLDVIVLDRRKVAHGSTTASTALVEWQIDIPLTHLRNQIGEARADRVWLRSLESAVRLKTKIAQLSLDCDFVERTSLELDGNVLDAQGLAVEAEARRAIGLPSQYVHSEDLCRDFSIAGRAALLSNSAAELNPVKLTNDLFHCVRQRGVELFENEEVTQVRPGASEVTVKTTGGRTIHAAYLVFATGYEVPHIMPADGYSIVSTFAIATKRQPHAIWKDAALISEASKPYLYIRTTPDGRVIAGGEDEPFSVASIRESLLEEKCRVIEEKLRKLLPKIDSRAEFRWSGAFGETDDSLPRIGKIPGSPRCFGVLGYGGNGTTYSMIAAELITSEICNEDDPDCRLFRFFDMPLLPP